MYKIMTLGRSEPGVIRYGFHPHWDNPARFFLYEEWESKTAHDAHFNSEAMQAMVPRFFELLTGAPDLTYYDAIVESRLGD